MRETTDSGGNSSLAVKSLEVAEKSEKRYNKHSIARRAVKKGRTEPAPNLEALQLIDPRDGKAVKKVSVAAPTSITGIQSEDILMRMEPLRGLFLPISGKRSEQEDEVNHRLWHPRRG